MSSALTAQPALRARRPTRARHLREQGPKRCQSGHGAGQWPRAQSSLHLRGPASVASAGFSCPEPSTFLQAPDLAYTPKIEILHACSTNAPFASSDATHRADHYDVLRSRVLQRVVAVLQVKVWSAVAARHGVGASERKWSSMGDPTTRQCPTGTRQGPNGPRVTGCRPGPQQQWRGQRHRAS